MECIAVEEEHNDKKVEEVEEDDDPILRAFTVQLFEKAANLTVKRHASFYQTGLILLPCLERIVAEYAVTVDSDDFEQVLFYDHYRDVKYGPIGIDFEYLKKLACDSTWPLFTDVEWWHWQFFGHDSYGDLPKGFCSRPFCRYYGSCNCGPDRQLPLRHVENYILHRGLYILGGCRLHRLDIHLYHN